MEGYESGILGYSSNSLGFNKSRQKLISV